MTHREALCKIVDLIRAEKIPTHLITLYVLWLNDGIEPQLVYNAALNIVEAKEGAKKRK